MTAPLLGYDGYIGTGKESTWGTAVTRTAWVTAKTLDLEKTIVTLALDHLTGSAGPYPRESIQSREDAGGSVSFYADYANKVLAHFLEAGIGQVATTGSGPYTHTFIPAATLPTGLTVEQGNVDTYEVFEGCKVSSWSFEVSATQAAVFTANIIAQTSGGLTTPNSSPPTVPAHSYPIVHSHAGTATLNGNTYRLRSFKVMGDNKLGRRDALGLQATDEPFSTAHREFRIEVELYATNEVIEGDFAGRSQADATFAFTDSPRSLTFTLRNAIPTVRKLTRNSVGGQLYRLTYQGFNNGTNVGLTAVLVNANSSAV